MLKYNRVILREVSRDQLASDYYLLVLSKHVRTRRAWAVAERVRALYACSKRGT